MNTLLQKINFFLSRPILRSSDKVFYFFNKEITNDPYLSFAYKNIKDLSFRHSPSHKNLIEKEGLSL